LPEVPTISESGLAGFNVETFYGISAPAGIPLLIRTRLNDEVVSAVRSADAKRRLLDEGCEPVGSSPEDYANVIRTEIAKWRKVVKGAGIQSE
jgi:tripartite-type tricarboxylate transporter receptor subunit TctC